MSDESILSTTPSCISSNVQNAVGRVEYIQSVPKPSMQEQKISTAKRCCQCSAGITESVSIINNTSYSYPETEKPKTRLSDYRVQDLKTECKKRQLPVSGAKPQLLERLKPYEDAILASTNIIETQQQFSDVTSLSSPISDSNVNSNSNNRLPPISNVISDYLQQTVSQPSSSTSDHLQQQVFFQFQPNHSQQQRQRQQILQVCLSLIQEFWCFIFQNFKNEIFSCF